MDILISIIVPVYNVRKYLHRCVDSILAQTYKNIEVLLIDDGSPDNSGEICDEYAEKDPRVRVFHKPNGGVSSARNLGLKEAKGQYIGFVDSDDYILPKMYENLLDLIQSQGVDIAICGYQKELKDGSFEPYWKDKVTCTFGKEQMIANLLTNKYYTCSVCSMLFCRDTIEEVSFDVNRKHNEDLLFIYEAMKRANKSGFTSEVRYCYCTNEGSATTSAFSDTMMDVVYISEYILQDIKVSIPNLYRLEQREFMRNNITTAMGAARAGYSNKENIARIQNNVREYLMPYLFSSAAFGYKRYALLLSLNWKVFSRAVR